MKVKVKKWPQPELRTPAVDAKILWLAGRMPGSCFERIALRYGKEKYLYYPSPWGEKCPSNGENDGIECRCDECDHYLTCFADWESHRESI